MKVDQSFHSSYDYVEPLFPVQLLAPVSVCVESKFSLIAVLYMASMTMLQPKSSIKRVKTIGVACNCTKYEAVEALVVKEFIDKEAFWS